MLTLPQPAAGTLPSYPKRSGIAATPQRPRATGVGGGGEGRDHKERDTVQKKPGALSEGRGRRVLLDPENIECVPCQERSCTLIVWQGTHCSLLLTGQHPPTFRANLCKAIGSGTDAAPANLQPSFTCPHSPPVQTFPRADASPGSRNRGGPTRPAQGAAAKENI
jgi:hypothetical protein